jgi:hypothetical protein
MHSLKRANRVNSNRNDNAANNRARPMRERDQA